MTLKEKAALYVRVSTLHQVDKDSLPFQREELMNYAKYVLNIEDVEIFEDAGYSAGNTARPKYQEMMSRIREGEFSHLLVWKIERISRNLKDFTEMYEELKEHNITFVSKMEQFDTSSAMGEAMIKIILVFAELERKLTAERVFSIMISRAEKGLWNGAALPLGYKHIKGDIFPTIEEKEAETVRYIFDLYEELNSTSKVAHRLNDENRKTKKGGLWRAKTVRDILKNPFYIGTYRYNFKEKGVVKDEKEWIILEDNHTPLVSKEQYKLVNDKLIANFQGVGRGKSIHTHLFSKILFCKDCNSLLTSSLDITRKDGYTPSRYICSSHLSTGQKKRCKSFLSDIIVAPFILNYISNLIRLQEKVNVKYTTRDAERSLLRGRFFVDILGIDQEGLKETQRLLFQGTKKHYETESKKNNIKDFEEHQFKKDKEKLKNAMIRLDDLYFYSEKGISKKDYVSRKNEIEERLAKIEDKLYENLAYKGTFNEVFFDNAKYFLITNEMQKARDIDYRHLLDSVGVDMLSDFIKSIVKEIIIHEKTIHAIVFQNGITHTFVYKPINERKKHARSLNGYRFFKDEVIKYITEYGSISRVEVEKLTNLKRSGATSLLNELIKEGNVERKGSGSSHRYYHKTHSK